MRLAGTEWSFRIEGIWIVLLVGEQWAENKGNRVEGSVSFITNMFDHFSKLPNFFSSFQN